MTFRGRRGRRRRFPLGFRRGLGEEGGELGLADRRRFGGLRLGLAICMGDRRIISLGILHFLCDIDGCRALNFLRLG